MPHVVARYLCCLRELFAIVKDVLLCLSSRRVEEVSMWKEIEAAPADAILGPTEAFKKDTTQRR